MRKSRIAFVGPSSNIPFSCVISLCCSWFLQTDIKLESLTTPRVGWSLLLAAGQCDYEVDMHTLPHFMGGKVKPSICHQLYRRHVKAILQKCFFMLVAAAVYWKWMESFNLILVWSQFYSFPLRVGGLDPCITHSFKNHRNHSNLASNFTDIRTSFMFFPNIWACRWRPSFLLNSFDRGNFSEQVE